MDAFAAMPFAVATPEVLHHAFSLEGGKLASLLDGAPAPPSAWLTSNDDILAADSWLVHLDPAGCDSACPGPARARAAAPFFAWP